MTRGKPPFYRDLIPRNTLALLKFHVDGSPARNASKALPGGRFKVLRVREGMTKPNVYKTSGNVGNFR